MGWAWVLLVALSLPATGAAAPTSGTASVGKLRSEADSAMASGDVDGSIKLLNQVIELEPGNERNYYKRSRAHLRKRKYREAISDLSAALRLKPTYKTALGQRAKLQIQIGRCSDAVSDMALLRQLDANAPELREEATAQRCAAHTEQAAKAERARDWRHARDELGQALALVDSSADLLLRRAKANLAVGDYFESVADSGRAIKLEPDSIPALELRGRAYYLLGEHEMSMNHLRQALKFDPEHQGVKEQYRSLKKIMKRDNAGNELFAAGKYDDAISEWQAAIAVDPSHFAYAGPTLVRVGKARVKQERWSDAIDAAQEAINVGYEGAMQDARLLMAEANLGNEAFDDAVRWYRQAVEANQEDQRAKDGLRRAEVALKQSKEIDYYKVLGVKRRADAKQIKKAYREAALKHHPDKVPPEEREKAEAEFMKIAEAYEILSDDEQRAKYDRGEDVKGQNRGPPGGGFPGHPFMHHGGPGGGQHFQFHFRH